MQTPAEVAAHALGENVKEAFWGSLSWPCVLLMLFYY